MALGYTKLNKAGSTENINVPLTFPHIYFASV